MIITTEENNEKAYKVNVLLKDGSLYSKEFRVMIDKTKPIFIDKQITDNDFEAKFEDEESGIQEVLYYITEDNKEQPKIEEFQHKELLNIEPNINYYVYAIGINNANNESEIQYLGEYKEKMKNGKSGNGE